MSKFGATGRHPYGSVGPDDEGELRLGMAADHAHGIVRIVFGKPVGWLGLPTNEAREFARMLIEKADELDSRKQ